jgi:cell division septation protein DedD
MYPSVEPEFYQPQPNIQTSENQPSTQTSATQHSTDLHPKPAKNWAVKVGRFSTEKDTNKTVTLLQKHGFDGFVKEIKSNDNLVMEVYVGPTQQRSQAESLNKKLQKSHISGRVVTTEYDSTKSTNDQ